MKNLTNKEYLNSGTVMDNVKYQEHKLAEKAQRIMDIEKGLRELKMKEEELLEQKPTCNKDNLTYEESIEFGRKIDKYEEELHNIQVEILKYKRQLSAVELQAQKLMPVSGVNIKVTKYSNEGQPLQTYCIQQKKGIEQSDSETVIHVEKV